MVRGLMWWLLIYSIATRSLARRRAGARTLARECSVCGVAFGHRSPAEKKMRVLLMIYLMWDDHAGTYSTGTGTRYVRTYGSLTGTVRTAAGTDLDIFLVVRPLRGGDRDNVRAPTRRFHNHIISCN